LIDTIAVGGSLDALLVVALVFILFAVNWLLRFIRASLFIIVGGVFLAADVLKLIGAIFAVTDTITE
jgi:hypothetical protein